MERPVKKFQHLSEEEQRDASALLMKTLLREKSSADEALHTWQKAVFPSGRSGFFDK